MKKIIILFSFIPLLALGQDKQKIVGGQDAGQFEIKFQAGLASRYGTTRSTEDFFCGGSIIQEDWILTAAHCMYDEFGSLLSPQDIFIFLNTWKLSNPNTAAEFIDVTEIVVHPQYNNDLIQNDIALVKLKTKTTLKPIKIPTQGNESLLVTGQKCTASGWGYLDDAGTQTPDKLQKVEVEVISTTQCNASTWYDGEILSGMFCAGYAQGIKDACSGDSGGPLFVTKNGDTTQIGIVSWGDGCAKPNLPGVYTKISDYTTWINTTMGNTAKIDRPSAAYTYSLTATPDGVLIHNTESASITFTISTITGQVLEKMQLTGSENKAIHLPKGTLLIEANTGSSSTFQKYVQW